MSTTAGPAADIACFDQLFDLSTMAFAVHDGRDQLVRCNQAFADLLGYQAADLIGTAMSELVHPDHRAARDAHRAAVQAGSPSGSADLQLLDRAGRAVWVRMSESTPSAAPSNPVLLCVQPAGDWHQRLDQLHHQATHDDLTGLLNRAGLREVLRGLLAEGRPGRLAVVDLNGLKGVNDDFGHAAGDRLLRVVARLLTSPPRSSRVVARFGGDEFVVIDWAPTRPLRPDLLAAIAVDIPLGDGITTSLSASVGEALFDGDADLDQVLRLADLEMYRHKRESGLERGGRPGAPPALIPVPRVNRRLPSGDVNPGTGPSRPSGLRNIAT